MNEANDITAQESFRKKRVPSVCDETVNLITLGDNSKTAKALVQKYFGETTNDQEKVINIDSN